MVSKTFSAQAQGQPRLRILLGEVIAIGPGKADLLAAIAETGSISAAGKRLGMGFRRAWQLVDTMNRCFREPLVVTSKGGPGRGGAALTALGEQVLAAYRQMESKAAAAVAEDLEGFAALLAPPDDGGA